MRRYLFRNSLDLALFGTQSCLQAKSLFYPLYLRLWQCITHTHSRPPNFAPLRNHSLYRRNHELSFMSYFLIPNPGHPWSGNWSNRKFFLFTARMLSDDRFNLVDQLGQEMQMFWCVLLMSVQRNGTEQMDARELEVFVSLLGIPLQHLMNNLFLSVGSWSGKCFPIGVTGSGIRKMKLSNQPQQNHSPHCTQANFPISPL